MVLSGSIGLNVRRFLEAGEAVVALSGRSYVYSGNQAGPTQRGNVMSEKIGTAYQVPTDKKLTVYIVHAGFGAAGIPGGQGLRSLTELAIIPIGTGAGTATDSYTKVAQYDLPVKLAYAQNPSTVSHTAIFSVSEDTLIEFEAEQYPKVGSLGRTTNAHPGGNPEPTSLTCDVQLIGVLGDA